MEVLENGWDICPYCGIDGPPCNCRESQEAKSKARANRANASALDEILNAEARRVADLPLAFVRQRDRLVAARREIRHLRESDSIVEYMRGDGCVEYGSIDDDVIDEMKAKGYTQGEDGRWTTG